MRNTGVSDYLPIFIYSTSSERRLYGREVTPTGVTNGKEFDSTPEHWAAAHAADTDLYTCAATPTETEPSWIKLEFGQTYYIEGIVIYHRFFTYWYDVNHCGKSEENFKKCIDQGNNVDVSVYQGNVKRKSCGTLQLTYGLEQSDQIYTLRCNSKGDSVTLSKSASSSYSYIAVCEVVVIKQGLLSFLFLAYFRPNIRSAQKCIWLLSIPA